MLSHKTEIRVRYADTDKMQFVYNGKYFEYFEVGRTEMMRANGFPYSEFEKNGFQLPVLETHAKYNNYAKYDDVLIIHAFVKELPLLKIKIDYEITEKETGRLIAEGYTVHVFMRSEDKKAIRPPRFFIDNIKPHYEEQYER